MICRDFPLLYSAQLDGHAGEYDQIALQRHLRECVVCRRSAAEMRRLRADLRALAAPFSSPGLTGQIQMRLRQEAEARARIRPSLIPGLGISWNDIRRFWFNSVANWLDGRRAKIFSQGIGALVSLPMFFVVVTEVFKQAYPTMPSSTSTSASASQVVYEDPGAQAAGSERLFRAALFPSPPPPILNPTYELVGAAANLRDGDVIMTAEVRKDGGAAKVDFVMPPNDPSIQEKLSTAMAQRGIFSHGVKPNQTTSPIAVVYLSSITTTGRL
jgi:anti-sigma factor RsiW